MPTRSRIHDHPDRERIEVELALARTVQEVADRWGIPRRTLATYRQKHMTQQQIARLRGMTPTEVEADIEALTRKGGEDAVIGFSRLIEECKEQAEKLDRMGMPSEAVKYRKLQLELYKEKAKIAALYPGRNAVTNNNLVLGDVGVLFDMIDATLRPFPEARQAVAAAFASAQRPALEHAA
jgi:hypothetical protein